MPTVLRYFDAAVVTLVVFFELCDYFCSIFDSSFSSFFRRRLSLLVVVAGRIVYVFASLPPLEIDHTLIEIVSIDFIVLITGITRTSFVVPRKLLSSFVPPRCCSFFLRSIPSTCRPFGILVELERIIVSVVLDLQLETLAIAMALSLLCL